MFEDLVNEFVLEHKESIYTSLDFGCGEGEVLAIILERNDIKCDRYDLFYFPNKVYKDKTYELILSTEVIEHLNNPIEILKELISHIKKDGFLVLMTAFRPLDIQEFLTWWYIRDITHIGFFTIKTFEYLAKELNLEIIKHNDKNTIMFKIL
ncbi:MAG: 2-polyprenyl-3-methyl-5-hydroxy-6-metoxy-1,4-benzoquinol methylase [Sulfurimonas sp.]|nr:MAG: 2-polyprenyl-3-methyl-5-hydroxy-6-metoxy-1,4-benzoquinol methylase [Sulfurimonas sp.]